MSESKITLTGWPAAVVAVLLLIGYGVTFVVSRRALDDEALAPVRQQLAGEYALALLPDADSGLPDEEEVGQLLALDRLELTNVSAHGSGDDVIVRVEPRVDGQLPPDGREVRYFKMEYSTLTGWRLLHESRAWSYYTRLF